MSLVFTVFFLALFLMDFRFWYSMRSWDTVKYAKEAVKTISPGQRDLASLPKEESDTFKHKYHAVDSLMEIAEHNCRISCAACLLSAAAFLLDFLYANWYLLIAHS